MSVYSVQHNYSHSYKTMNSGATQVAFLGPGSSASYDVAADAAVVPFSSFAYYQVINCFVATISSLGLFNPVGAHGLVWKGYGGEAVENVAVHVGYRQALGEFCTVPQSRKALLFEAAMTAVPVNSIHGSAGRQPGRRPGNRFVSPKSPASVSRTAGRHPR